MITETTTAKVAAKLSLAGILLAGGITVAAPALAGPKPYLGDITITGYTFCPRGTIEALGQLMDISANEALFSLYGTT